ncbi:zinc finger MYM-type protein 1-like, partial [Aphis craccivora]
MEKGSFDWKTNLVGQSYDEASNMSGNYKGLQSRIRDVNPQANLYMHFYGVQKKRAAIFRENQLKTNSEKNQKSQIHAIQRLSTTRWGSHSAALNVVLKFHDAVIITLKTIRSSEGPSDAK